MKIFSKIKFVFLIFLLLSAAMLTGGCTKDKPLVLFSSTPFSKEKGYTPQNVYKRGDRIYYLLYNPKEFKTRLLKVQVFRKDPDADDMWGYEYLYNKTAELNDKKFYTDYFIINKAGYYIVRIFEFTNTLKPVITGIIKVND